MLDVILNQSKKNKSIILLFIISLILLACKEDNISIYERNTIIEKSRNSIVKNINDFRIVKKEISIIKKYDVWDNVYFVLDVWGKTTNKKVERVCIEYLFDNEAYNDNNWTIFVYDSFSKNHKLKQSEKGLIKLKTFIAMNIKRYKYKTPQIDKLIAEINKTLIEKYNKS